MSELLLLLSVPAVKPMKKGTSEFHNRSTPGFENFQYNNEIAESKKAGVFCTVSLHFACSNPIYY